MTTLDDTTARAEVPPRHDLTRVAPFSLRAADEANGDDGFTLDGFAAVFNRETVIDSWEGRFKETIAPGSMKKSFRESPPRIQFDHGRHPLIGSLPIASLVRVAEEIDPVLAPEGGAHVVGRLLDNWLVQPVRDAITAKAVDGMSFRFEVVQDEWRDATGKLIRDESELRDLLRRTSFEDVPEAELPVRTLKALKVPELGPVTWPAYTDTSVSVRSLVPNESGKVTIDLDRLHEPAERSRLATLVLAAERAEADGNVVTDDPPNEPDASQSDTTDVAVEHEHRADDSQTDTTDEVAVVHESADAEPTGLRVSLDRWSRSRAFIVENAMKGRAH